jgi:hypothetical protein
LRYSIIGRALSQSLSPATMNAFAFASHAEVMMIYPAIGLGVAIPALVCALTKVSATLWMEPKAA